MSTRDARPHHSGAVRAHHPSASAGGRADRRADRVACSATAMWFEIRPSVYAIAGAPQSWHQILLASVLAPSGAIVGVARHRGTPLGAEGLRPTRAARGRVDAQVRGSRLDGVRGRRSGALFDSDLTVRHRIPTVTAERALIDVSSRLTDRPARPCARRRDPAEADRSRGVPSVRATAAAGTWTIDVEGARGARRTHPRLRPGRQRPRDPCAARARRGRAPSAQAAAPHPASTEGRGASTSRIPS